MPGYCAGVKDQIKCKKCTMNAEDLREYALSLENVSEGFPFGEDTLVMKIFDKIFLLVSLSSPVLQFNVKCDPEYAEELREAYPAVMPGYHMNKKHWNTVIVDGTISASLLKQFVYDSYKLVRGKK